MALRVINGFSALQTPLLTVATLGASGIDLHHGVATGDVSR
jgi:hypothetical protein